MRYRHVVSLISVFVVLALPAAAETSAEWRRGPASWLMTAEEKEQWQSLKTDADADRFIALFWAKRDPTPDTPWNEFRQSFEARVHIVDERFREGRTRGSMTARGRIYLLLGAPLAEMGLSGSPAQVRPPRPQSRVAEVPGMQPAAPSPVYVPPTPPVEIWDYRDGLSVIFDGTVLREDHRLRKALESAIRDTIRRPDLKEVPRYGLSEFATPALRTAIEAFRTAPTSSYKGKEIFASFDESVNAAGEYFVPVSLYVPAKTGLTADRELTFFGVVTDANGETVTIMEELARLSQTKTDLHLDRSLMLPAGQLTATFGLAEGGQPLTMTTVRMQLAGKLDRDAPAVSKLILSNDVHPTTARTMTDPFVFGGIKVVPKGDRIFRAGDELWYFFELRNPGLDPRGAAKPRVQVKLEITGVAMDGARVASTTPAADVEPMPLEGAPGRFAVGQAIPLASFKPGAYALKVTVTDLVRKSDATIEATFRVVAQ